MDLKGKLKNSQAGKTNIVDIYRIHKEGAQKAPFLMWYVLCDLIS
jgi:hypothetical protein